MFKKRYLFLIMLISLFAISAVSAEDNITDDIASFDDLQSEINAIESGGTLNLTKDYKYVSGSTDGINISNPITINGNGFSIDGDGKSAIFNVSATNNVGFYNIVFKNGYATNGGAISFGLYQTFNCNIVNCTFDNNVVSDYGGAICFSASALGNNIINNTFTNNIADSGGAIACREDVIGNSFMKNNFINNSDISKSHGGAIYLGGISEYNQYDELNFISNHADMGSAFYISNSYMDNFTKSSFINNSANYASFCFVQHCENSIFSELNFINNTAKRSSGALSFSLVSYSAFDNINFINNTGGYGGAVTVNEMSFFDNFTNINFINNTASYGGAIYLFDESDYNIWENVTFLNNKASDGGAIYVNYYFLRNNFNNVGFINNTASNRGGAFYISDVPASFNIFDGCSFISNYAVNGAVLYQRCFSQSDEFNDCIFMNNVANDTGILYFLGYVVCEYNSVQFINNTAENYGVLFFSEESEVNFMNCTFNDNSASYVSDIAYMGDAFSSIINSTFDGKNNIYVSQNSNVNLVNNTEFDPYVKGTFFVLNDGVLKLEKNDLNNVIVNNGEIISETSIFVLNNETLNVSSPEVYLSAFCVDDNSNYILGDYLTFDINGTPFKAFFNGEYIIYINYLLQDCGSYLINASINSNLNYCNYNTGIINLNPKKEAMINASEVVIAAGEFAFIEIELPEDAGGIVSAIVEGKTYLAAVEDGKATICVPPLEDGEYGAYISYSGDDIYGEDDTYALIIVLGEISVAAPDVTKYYRGPERFVVTVTKSDVPLIYEDVLIELNGLAYLRTTDENGTASIALNLPSGNYTAGVIVGDVSVNSSVIILPTVNGTDITKVYRNATQYYATFFDSEGNYLKEGTNVTFNINGVFYNRTVSGDKGLARLNINLEQGEYIITAINPVTSENAANTIVVIPRIIENRDIIKYFRNGTQYTVKLIGDDGNPVGAGETVRFNINGVFYERQTNESGIAQMNINLNPGTYIITAEYNGSTVSNNITVLSVLTAEDLTKKYGSDEPFEAKLVDGEGKAYANQKIEFNINGVFYYRTTDSNGIAKLNINLQAGEYIITSRYEYATISNKVTITL